MSPGERQVAPTVDGIRFDHVARYEWVASQLPQDQRVIDVACGVGYGSNILARHGAHVVAFDQDAEAIAYANEHYAHAAVRFEQADASNLSVMDAHVAVCFETIEHILDPLPLLQTLSQSAPVLFASVPNEDVFPYAGYAFHYRHYTKSEFEALLAKAGWRVTAWFGQADDQSAVEPDVDGRTLIARAERSDPFMLEPLPRKKKEGLHVAILALGPSLELYSKLVKTMGGRRKFCDETWAINAVGDVYACDRIFHMDDVRIQEIRAAAQPDSNIASMLQWIKQHPGPVYTSRVHQDYPGLVAYPLEDVINSTNFAYFNSTAAYAVAYAIHIGATKISLFGFDFTYANAHHAEKGRANVEFFLGIAAARGIKLSVPRQSSLMDACTSQAERLYGFDTLAVTLEQHEGRIKVAFTERDTLPTAAEIEHRYDHTRHPSPLIDDAAED